MWGSLSKGGFPDTEDELDTLAFHFQKDRLFQPMREKDVRHFHNYENTFWIK